MRNVKKQDLTLILPKVVTFTYDPFGRRLSKSVHKEEIEEDDENDRDDDDKETPRATYYVYDNEDIILEYNHKGKITARYVHGLGIDEPLAIERKGKVYYYHADGLGSITALTDSKGKAVVRYEYDSFGNLKHHGHKVKQPYTYTAREYDKETGLYYYRARYYDATIGRFITPDPSLRQSGSLNIPFLLHQQLQSPQELNPFGYSRNNPLTYIDPFGLATTYMCVRIYFTEYFICFRVKDTCPPEINPLGPFFIPKAPCNFTCYFTEKDWNTGLQWGKKYGVL